AVPGALLGPLALPALLRPAAGAAGVRRTGAPPRLAVPDGERDRARRRDQLVALVAAPARRARARGAGMSRTEPVAVLGTGIMGVPMARNIAAAGIPVRAWNRTAARAEPLAAHGVTVAASPAEAVAGVGIVLTMLADGPAVHETMTAAL